METNSTKTINWKRQLDDPPAARHGAVLDDPCRRTGRRGRCNRLPVADRGVNFLGFNIEMGWYDASVAQLLTIGAGDAMTVTRVSHPILDGEIRNIRNIRVQDSDCRLVAPNNGSQKLVRQGRHAPLLTRQNRAAARGCEDGWVTPRPHHRTIGLRQILAEGLTRAEAPIPPCF